MKRRRFKPHGYQEAVLKMMDENAQLALLLDPGMGKTPICLEDFRRKRSNLDATHALVVAPLRTCRDVWPPEADKWFGFHDFRVHVAHGKGKNVNLCNAADIVVINPEGLPWLLENAKGLDQFDVLYVDESTMFKRKSSKRTTNLHKIAHKMNGGIHYRYILTGTPAPNGVQDLHGQFYVMKPEVLGKTMHEFYTGFRFSMRKTPWGVEWTPTKKSTELIQEAIAPHSVRLDATDHLDLPDIVYTKRMVDLPSEARQVYKDLENDMFSEMDAGLLVAANAGALSSKCRQVANGAVYLTPEGEASFQETRKIEYLHQAKVKELTNLFEELGQKPLMIAYEFKHDLTMIRQWFKEHYGFTPFYIGGGADDDEVSKAIVQWNAGDLPVLLVNPQSAAHGLNLQAGGYHLCWYGITWNLEHYLQLNRRLWRQGQEHGVFIHHILARNTIDEVIWEACSRKNVDQRALLRWLKEYR